MSDELAELRARVARLEAERAVISTFNEYFYNMDIGYTEGILDVFMEDGLLEVVNFPPGTMEDLRFEGRAAMRELYGPHSSAEPTLSGGHHSANVQVNVAEDCSSAELSAYFMTSGGHGGLGGGMYQGTFVPTGTSGASRTTASSATGAGRRTSGRSARKRCRQARRSGAASRRSTSSRRRPWGRGSYSPPRPRLERTATLVTKHMVGVLCRLVDGAPRIVDQRPVAEICVELPVA